jgi:hypothetical protein
MNFPDHVSIVNVECAYFHANACPFAYLEFYVNIFDMCWNECDSHEVLIKN